MAATLRGWVQPKVLKKIQILISQTKNSHDLGQTCHIFVRQILTYVPILTFSVVPSSLVRLVNPASYKYCGNWVVFPLPVSPSTI